VVDADHRDHHVENNCYDPVCFRLVLEVTSSNYRTDLRDKVKAYASAKIPVYVIVDRKHQRLHVLTEPAGVELAIVQGVVRGRTGARWRCGPLRARA
jgi:Uma2 family endonuclease